jgi:small subunit ribosomal protein S8
MYINLLTKIKNAQALRKDSVRFPYSKMDESVLGVLASDNYIGGFEKKGKNPKKYFEVSLLYKNGRPTISEVAFISKPSRRVYRKATELYPVKQGYGSAVISTSQGIMTDKEARKKKVGGQVLFYIW